MTSAPEKTPSELLATPLQFLKGVGPARAELFAKLGLHVARDLLFFFPRDYQDLSDLREISDLEEGKPLSVLGTITEIDQRNLSSGGTMLGALIQRGNESLRAVWFNQPFMLGKLAVGSRVLAFGRAKKRGGRWEMSHPRLETIEGEQDTPPHQFEPIYPLTEGLAQHHVRRAIKNVLEGYLEALAEVFPEELLAQYELPPLQEALPAIHFPESQERLASARRRFVFQELFILQLALALRRHEQRDLAQAPSLPATAKIDARIRRLLPFELTAGQESVIAEVSGDMALQLPMHRLLQGEVGSGKTIVAVYAMMVCVAHGQQAVLMAPTEVLARQHFDTLSRTLSASQVRLALVTGGQTAKERQVALSAIAAGEVDLVLGTQAIVLGDVQFKQLGLVVIDEQHKFGVRQRAALMHAGLEPHYLVMTATPIPRTVSLTMFGDLDVSTLRDSPPGRQPVHTYLVDSEKETKWWDFVRKKLLEGRQAYVIAPLVEETESLDLENVEGAFEQLTSGELAEFRLDLIHGRMSSTDKDVAMRAFRAGDTQVLVSTSVVEVGVDIPNATVMTIQGADRFGLAQLHQLRGRISRGQHPGYCGVQAQPQTDEARQRLEAFVASTDGFELSEIDFRLRGPGNLLGTQQHGLPPLRIADLIEDAETLEEARSKAQQLIVSDASLSQPEHALLRKMVLVRYGKALDLSSVG